MSIKTLHGGREKAYALIAGPGLQKATRLQLSYDCLHLYPLMLFPVLDCPDIIFHAYANSEW